MSTSTPDVTKVPTLTGQLNYREWSLEARAIAMLGAFWGAFDGTNIAPTGADAAQNERVADREMKAQGLVLKTVSHLLREELMNYKVVTTAATTTAAAVTRDPKAKDLWDYLETKFQKKDGISALIDFQLFLRATLTDDGTLEAQLNKLTELRTKAATSGFTVADWQFAAIMLMALPQSYTHIKDSFLTTGTITALDPTAVRSRILETEVRRNADPSANAISLSTKSPGNKGKRPPKPPPGTGKCFHCGKPGHWANRCREKAKQDNKSAGLSAPKQDKGGTNLNVIATTSEQCDSNDWSAYAFGAPENWLFDTGASDHMTPFGSDFIRGSYISFLESHQTVTLGDNATRLQVMGKGSVERWVETGHRQFHSITLTGVLHVRGIQRHFLSPGRLNNKGWIIPLTAETNFLVHKGNMRFYGQRIGSLYQVIMYGEKPPGATTLNSIQALPIKVWHERMGHAHWEALKQARLNPPPLRGIKLDSSEPPKHTCPGCVAGKDKRRAFKSSTSESRAKEPLERLHADLMGPMETVAIGGSKWRYSFVITDEYSRHAWTAHLMSKDQTLEKFKGWVSMIEQQTGHRVKILRSDRGGEFISADFSAFLEERGIVRETSAPHTPQQNGTAERMNQTLIGGARAMLQHSGLTKGFWAEALDVATHVFNRAPRKGLSWRTPYELLYGRVPDISHLRIFGCAAWVLQEKGKKWDPNSKPMVFIGYEKGSKAYRVWNPETRSIVVSTSIRLDESRLPNKPQPKPTPVPTPLPAPSSSEPKYVDIGWALDEPTYQPPPPPPAPVIAPRAVTPSTPSSSGSSSEPTEKPPTRPPTPPSHLTAEPPDSPCPLSDSETDQPSTSEKRRPKRAVKPIVRYEPGTAGLQFAESEGEEFFKTIDEQYQTHVEAFINNIGVDEPTTYREAQNSNDWDQWKKAMDDEMNSLQEKKVIEIVDRPENRKVISCKWVYRIKRDSKGNINRYKARLVARGFTQVYGLDYMDTYAPVTRLETIRLLCALAVKRDWEVRHVDVKTAYLNGDLDEEIFMEIPEGYNEGLEGKVILLRKAIYGLRQAGRQWYRKLKEALKKFGLKQTASDPHTFVVQKVVQGTRLTLILPIYVDDLIPIGNKTLTDEFEYWIRDYFEVTDPTDAEYFLGIRVHRDRTCDQPWLTLDQHQFIKTIQSRFDVVKTKITVPISTNFHAIPNPDPKEENDLEFTRLYQSKLGSLMYLMLGTRPDIAYAVGVLGRFASNPSPDHMTAIDRLFRYIDHTQDLCLVYTKQNGGNTIDPVGYVDSDLAGDIATAKSTRGYVFFLGDAAFSWSSKLQPTTASSTAEAEYISLYFGGQQAAWLRNFYEELYSPLDHPIQIYCDSQPAIAILKNEGNHAHSRYFHIRYHVVRERVENGEIEVDYIGTDSNIADVLTKALNGPKTSAAVDRMGLRDLNTVLYPEPTVQTAEYEQDASLYEDAKQDTSGFSLEDWKALIGTD